MSATRTTWGPLDNTTGSGVAAECVTVTTANSRARCHHGRQRLGCARGSSGSVSDSVTVSGNATGGSPTGTVTFYSCMAPTPSEVPCRASASSSDLLGKPDGVADQGHQPRLERLDHAVHPEHDGHLVLRRQLCRRLQLLGVH